MDSCNGCAGCVAMTNSTPTTALGDDAWLKELERLAMDFAHCYSFVGDDTMPKAKAALLAHASLRASQGEAAVPPSGLLADLWKQASGGRELLSFGPTVDFGKAVWAAASRPIGAAQDKTLCDLLTVAEHLREWCKAVPDGTPLPAMPGLDGDFIAATIEQARAALTKAGEKP